MPCDVSNREDEQLVAFGLFIDNAINEARSRMPRLIRLRHLSISYRQADLSENIIETCEALTTIPHQAPRASRNSRRRQPTLWALRRVGIHATVMNMRDGSEHFDRHVCVVEADRSEADRSFANINTDSILHDP